MTKTPDRPKDDVRTTRTGGKHPCPSCGSRNVAEIRYGFPIPGTFDTPDAKAGEIILGGDVLWPDRPEFQCHRCGHAWRESPVGHQAARRPMSTRQTLQLILGFIVAGLVVVVLIPLGLRQASVAFDHLVGIQLIPNDAVRVAAAAVLVLIGLALGLRSIVAQVTIGKGGPAEVAGIELTPKTQKLIVTGPYKYTRNPMLLGTSGFYCGIAVFLNSPVALAIVTLFLALMLAEVKLIEEPRLLRDFGIEYEDYRRRVSMFIPWRHRQG